MIYFLLVAPRREEERDEEENKWRKMTINFFFECFFVSCFLPFSLTSTSLHLLCGFKLACKTMFSIDSTRCKRVVLLLKVFSFPFRSVNDEWSKQKILIEFEQIGTNWCSATVREDSSRIQNNKKRARKKIPQKWVWKRFYWGCQMPINYRICRQITKETLRPCCATKVLLQTMRNFTLNFMEIFLQFE